MDRFETMQTFVTVAEQGSFIKAAEKLRISSQLASKYVSQLEEHLGVRLLNRTTRKVRLTEAGEQCVQQARDILESVHDLEGNLKQLQSQAQGILYVTAPASFAHLHLASFISDFRRQHPKVGLNIQLNDRKIDVVEEGFDVALRIGHLKNSSLIAKKIAPIRMVMCAAPAYLDKHGRPKHPQDLIPEHFMRYSYQDSRQLNVPLADALRNQYRENIANLVCNNGEVLANATIAADGYILQPTFIVGRAIKAGKLECMLQDYEPDPVALYAVYPHRKLVATKLRAFLDLLDGYFGDPPYWDVFD